MNTSSMKSRTTAPSRKRTEAGPTPRGDDSSRLYRFGLECLFVLVLATAMLNAAPAIGAPSESETAASPAQELFLAQKCNLCHGAAAAGIEAKTKSDKLKGPDLSGYATDDLAQTGAYLRQEIEIDGKKHKRKNKITDEELSLLLEWLSSLDAAADNPDPEQP